MVMNKPKTDYKYVKLLRPTTARNHYDHHQLNVLMPPNTVGKIVGATVRMGLIEVDFNGFGNQLVWMKDLDLIPKKQYFLGVLSK